MFESSPFSIIIWSQVRTFFTLGRRFVKPFQLQHVICIFEFSESERLRISLRISPRVSCLLNVFVVNTDG